MGSQRDAYSGTGQSSATAKRAQYSRRQPCTMLCEVERTICGLTKSYSHRRYRSAPVGDYPNGYCGKPMRRSKSAKRGSERAGLLVIAAGIPLYLWLTRRKPSAP